MKRTINGLFAGIDGFLNVNKSVLVKVLGLEVLLDSIKKIVIIMLTKLLQTGSDLPIHKIMKRAVYARFYSVHTGKILLLIFNKNI